MNDEPDIPIPPHQILAYEKTLSAVRSLSDGSWYRDHMAPFFRPHSPITPLITHKSFDDDGNILYFECRACKYRFEVKPDSCCFCSCSYFDACRSR